MPNREGGSAFRRGATKHQIKKSDESKMTNFVFCFCFLSSSSLEKIQKEKGREETWERGHGFTSSTRSLFLREETHQSHAHKNARDVSSTERSIQTHFSCVRNVSIVVVVVLLLHETKERYKREPIFEKNHLSIGNHHERDDGKKPKRPTERATRTTNGPGRVREGEDNATLRAN